MSLRPNNEPPDALTAPVTTVYRAPCAAHVTAANVEAWERSCLAVCGHTRERAPRCRTCRDVDQVVIAVASGASVRVYPSR